MSEHLLHTMLDGRATVVATRLPPRDLIANWQGLRPAMLKSLPSGFSRDEWAYLLTFLDGRALEQVLAHTVGGPVEAAAGPPRRMLRTRGQVALWLPNNVSMLGPLTLVLVSLTASRLRVKTGSHSENLTAQWVDFALAHLPPCPLRTYLHEFVTVDTFGRDDSRNREWAGHADVRLVFGGDAAAQAIDSLPHPPTSQGFAFVDRQSQVWLEPAACHDDGLRHLIKVFAMYGRAGCTSPRRLVLLDAGAHQAEELARRLVALWPSVVRTDVPIVVASRNLAAEQWGRAAGWQTWPCPRHAALIAVGTPDLPDFERELALPIVPLTLAQAVAALPANVQTIGHLVTAPEDSRFLAALAMSPVKRFVPVGAMHHFGPVWDGMAFVRQLFEEVELR